MQKTTFKTYLLPLVLYLCVVLAPQRFFAQAQKDSITTREFKEPSIEDYEQLVFEATQDLLSNPVKETCAEFVSACKIVTFWMHQDTGFGIPLGGNFYYKLTNNDNQQYYYAVSMVNYLLDQKINHNRILSCLPTANQNYRHQEDVKEVRLKAAEIFLKFAKKRKNNIKMIVRARKYLKFYRKNTLHEKFAEELDELPTKKEINSPFITYFMEK